MSQNTDNEPLDVLGFGCAVLDYVGTVDEFPAPDSKTRVFEMEEHGGGVAATAMVACRRLGMRAGLIAKVGEDEAADKIMRGLEDEGVDVSRVLVGPGERSMTGYCFVQRKTGRRIIYYYRSQLRPLRIGQIDESILKRVPVLMVDGSELSAGGRAAEIVRGAGGVTVIDAGSKRPAFREALPHIDYLVASWDFARDHTGADTPEKALEELRWTGFHRAVVITLGDEGYLAAQGGHTPYRGDAFRVKARDTTGAGDTFHGAFCVGLRKGWELEKVCAFSAACAALQCTRVGGRPGIPTWDEAIAFLRENDRRFTWEDD